MKPQPIRHMYQLLYRQIGPRGWWPADTPQEVMIGAILTQNITWKNAAQAVQNLKRAGKLSLRAIRAMHTEELAALIRPARFLNQKAAALQRFADYFGRMYAFSVKRMARRDTGELRAELLEQYRIGPETADSILLYALAKPVFVIDAYTRRICSRHGLLTMAHSYDDFQQVLTAGLAADVQLYNEFHALLVYVGHRYCKPKPQCDGCPLRGMKIGTQVKKVLSNEQRRMSERG